LHQVALKGQSQRPIDLRSVKVKIVDEVRKLPFPTAPTWPRGKVVVVLQAYFLELAGADEMQVLYQSRYRINGCNSSIPDHRLVAMWQKQCSSITKSSSDAAVRWSAELGVARQKAKLKRSLLAR